MDKTNLHKERDGLFYYANALEVIRTKSLQYSDRGKGEKQRSRFITKRAL